MTPGSAIKQGFSLVRSARLAVWILFLVNLGLAAVAALPIYRGILRATGHSLISRTLLSGFSSDWLTDFYINSSGSFERYASFIALLGLLSIPVNSILAGGVLARFRALDQPSSVGLFFRETKLYTWRFVRLMVIGLILYWIVFRVLNQGLDHAFDKWSRHWLDDRPVFWLRLGIDLLLLLGLAFVNLVMDYARVKLVMDECSSAIEAFLAALGFSLGRLRPAAIVYALPSLGGIGLLVFYRLAMPWNAVNTSLGRMTGPHYREPLVLALLFIGQQAIMFGRYYFRVATWASEWSYFRSSKG